jgi:hypothetical protein
MKFLVRPDHFFLTKVSYLNFNSYGAVQKVFCSSPHYCSVALGMYRQAEQNDLKVTHIREICIKNVLESRRGLKFPTHH